MGTYYYQDNLFIVIVAYFLFGWCHVQNYIVEYIFGKSVSIIFAAKTN